MNIFICLISIIPDKVRKLIFELQYKLVFLRTLILIPMVSFDPQNIQDSINLIRKSTTVALLTHMHPDGDAMGSTIGMFHYLESLGKECRIILNDRYPHFLEFMVDPQVQTSLLVHEEDPVGVKAYLERCDLTFCMDFNRFSRLEHLEEAAKTSKAPRILIDHHPAPAAEEFDLLFSETAISSASELTWWFLKEILNGETSRLPKASLTALMTGMTTDTNNFANSVFPSTLQMASELLEAGVDRDEILYNLYNRLSENRLRLMGHLMQDVLEITEDGVAFILLSEEDQKRYPIREGETEGFVNMPLSIDCVKMSIFSREDNGKARISIRSKKGTSANRCAARWFNGGGHEQAAGGRLIFREDVPSFKEVPDYIRTSTHKFMTEDNE